MGQLETLFDPQLEVDPGWTAAGEAQVQLLRVHSELLIAQIGMGLIGRLGGDATRDERALDKRRWRRVYHAFNGSAHEWQVLLDGADCDWEALADARAQAAQRDWSQWYAEHEEVVQAEMVRVATHARRSGARQWGNRAVNRLRNELERVSYALRED